jgi:cardiolipin synthase C
MAAAGPDLATVVAELAERLPPGHVAAWAHVLRSEPAADASLCAKLVDARPGFALGSAAAKLVGAWQSADLAVSGAGVALALEAAARVVGKAAAHRSQVVVSGPASDTEAVRLTSSVISELVHDARESLLIVSFAAFGVSDVVHELKLAVQRGVRVDLVLETTAGDGGTLHGSVGAVDAFESIRHDVALWTWPASRRPVTGGSRAAMHAKLVAADQRIALLGSANLTDKALAQNLELGVIIRDPQVVRRLVGHFRSLMKPASGPLERAVTN